MSRHRQTMTDRKESFALIRLKHAQKHYKGLAYARDKENELALALWK
jgi:hypothetical protein